MKCAVAILSESMIGCRRRPSRCDALRRRIAIARTAGAVGPWNWGGNLLPLRYGIGVEPDQRASGTVGEQRRANASEGEGDVKRGHAALAGCSAGFVAGWRSLDARY